MFSCGNGVGVLISGVTGLDIGVFGLETGVLGLFAGVGGQDDLVSSGGKLESLKGGPCGGVGLRVLTTSE